MTKWMKLLGVSALSAMLLTACGNDDNQSPAPDDDTTIEDTDLDTNDVDPDRGTDLDNDNESDVPDENKDDDLDPTKDDNDPGEDMIEDKDDMNDKDDLDR